MALLRQRDFLLLFVGQGVSRLGDGLYTAVVVWLAWTLTHDPSAVALVTTAAYAPAFLATPWDRRFSSSLGALLTGNVMIYAFGVTWLAHNLHVNTAKALEYGLYPFVPGDLIKLYLAAAVLPTAWRYAGRNK